MAHHHKIAEEARQAYDAGRMAESELLYRRAASDAFELGDLAAWFKHTVWAANATWLRGDAKASLTLLLEARQSEPEDASQNERWVARKLFFVIARSTRPERARLEHFLADLRSYAAAYHVPGGDFAQLEGRLFLSRGDWRTALTRHEAAWQAYDGNGYYKSGKAYSAAHCCLRLGQLAACRDWIAALDQEGKDASHHVWSAELTLRLAIAEGQPLVTLLSHLRTYIDRAAKQQRYGIIDEVRELTARVHLLDPYAGDPATHFHPARAELRRSPKNRQDAHYRYASHLLFLDYRLACLRHGGSIPAVDDFYYYQPQQVPAHLMPADPDQFQRRLHKARSAAQSTLRYARDLDNLLECDWRQREVQARSERIEEMARAVPS